ncbi:MAG: hypothetical protein NT169_22135 [Chloroflexi bacterium]|nr:hypothetical protein [Chloroflexota bacterium]
MTWRRVAKRIAYWTMPPGFQDLARRRLSGRSAVTKEPLSEIEQCLLSRNLELHNRHLGERCFILATGPSIKTQDLKLLKTETCIAVSNFLVHPDYAVIRPQYYCLAPYHPPITEDSWQAWMTEIAGKTLNATMFFGLADRERNEINGRFAGRQVHYLKFGGALDDLVRDGVDLSMAVPGPQSVTIMALLIAIYMGFKNIYLLGCDHDWILHVGTSTHFYNESQHALNRSGYSEWHKPELGSEFDSLSNLWRQYKTIRVLATGLGISISNATGGGILDVFPRVRFENLMVKL